MKKNSNKIWLGTDQLENTPAYQAATDAEVAPSPEAENPQLESSRRDFLKYLGFGMTAATIASCDIPVRKAIPYVSKPDTIVPGVATYFASTFIHGGDWLPVLVKTREGRPIKIEGNSLSTLTEGGTSARAQASVLSMYDTSRFDGPYRLDNGSMLRTRNYQDNDDWSIFDAEIKSALNPSSQIRIVGHTVLSPSLKLAVQDFKARYPNTALVQYDPVSCSALLDAHQNAFGVRAIPGYRFDRADTIVSFNADFLGTWISPVQYAKDYIKGRDTEGTRMNRHVQVESHMSLTGSNADNRILVRPSMQGEAIRALYNEVVGGGSASNLDAATNTKITAVARALRANGSNGLVVSGSNNLAEQTMVVAINNAIGAYGNTIDTQRWSYQRQGSDQDLGRLADELNAGTVDAVIVLDGANPAWDNHFAERIASGLSRVETTISMSGVPNETVARCKYVTPNHHYLESWGDAEPVQGVYTLVQPSIVPIFASVNRHGTRQEGESLLIWSDAERYDPTAEQPYLEYVKTNWESTAFAGQNRFATFRAFWDSALHDGLFETAATGTQNTYGIGYDDVGRTTSIAEVGEDVIIDAEDRENALSVANGNRFRNAIIAAGNGRITVPGTGQEISFYETVNMGNGSYANNPWLQECPDPVARTVWGNYLSIPVSYVDGNSYTAYKGLNEEEYKGRADVAAVTFADLALNVTTVRQFGQMPETFGLALGYGRHITGQPGRALGEEVGVNVYPWTQRDEDGYVQYYVAGIDVSDAVEVEEEFASVQYHHTMGLTTKSETGAMVYYNKRTGETEEIVGKLSAEQEEYLDPFHVDEKTVMELGEGMQGGLVDRSIIYQGTFAELPELKDHIQHKREHAQHLNEQTLYPYEEYAENIYGQGHWWAMHVDLTKCIGCAACEVACVAENNVQVVGKYEVWRHHEMKWMRIDRYFYGDVENPRAVYQPMMCQHCDNAPCENVCPVNASQHSNEGLNQMIYNRCIGTRYCANNCPYKVRRFNWLDYTTGDLFSTNEPELAEEELPFGADNLTRMVLNPDVTVRSRGVIEKCSFCAQRLQSGKLTAKIEKRPLRDADVRTACQTACPTGAITFGDRNIRGGDVRSKLNNPLNYLALEEVNVQPGVFYAARVHNPMEELEEA